VRVRPYLILAPAFLVLVGILYPFGLALFYSFTNYTLTSPNYQFVGLNNYVLMVQDPDFGHSVYVTLAYAIIATAVQVLLGLGIAILLTQETFISKVLRTVLVFPLMIAPVIGALIWKLMAQPSVGIITQFLDTLGIHGVEWGATDATALPAVILIDIWIFTPFAALLLFAGLQGLPREPYEAANVDGASSWFTFRNLTLPLLTPVLLIVIIFRFMDSLKVFDIIYASTGGGPGQALMNFQLQAYYNGFLYLNLSYGLAYMMVLWAFIYIVSQLLINYWSKAQKRAAGL